MSLLGSSRPKHGMLGAERFGITPDTQQAVDTYAAMPQQAPQQRPQGFWQGGEKFGVRDGIAGILAAVGDAFTQQSGGRPMATQGLLGSRMQAQQMAQEAQAAQIARAQAWEDFQRKERYKAQNRAPHYWETNDGSLGSVGPDGLPRVLYQDPTPKINWITADNPDGTKTVIPMGPNGPIGQGGAGGQMPTFSQDDWDKAGGTGSNAGGGFRPRW